MIRDIIRKLFLVKEIISKEGNVHFRRWRILQTPWFAIYVHNILRSVEDKDPHDHPWWFMSLILWGGYVEDRVDENGRKSRHYRFAGRMFSCKTTEFHKIRLMRPTWTLVLTGPRTHELWGYMTEDGWIDHVTYRERKNTLNK